MCGICGVLRFDGQPPDAAVLSMMADSLRHRGPDGAGTYVNGPIGLGHRRLAIIDLSAAAAQPMTNEDGSLWLTYNGEIYNFADIRQTLISKGHTFRSRTDSEVVLHAYEEWGLACLERFNGMFAFALWDEPAQRLWLVRDRLGIKPLFYALLPDRLLFGSEIKAILADPAFDRQIDLVALHHYLSLNYMPAPYTLFQHVRQLLPGHYLLAEGDGCWQAVEYWDVEYHEDEDRGDAYYLSRLGEVLSEAVRGRLVSDVPFGAFLSGGVDSGSIVYWMSQAMTQPVQTFSIGFPQKSYDELGYARQVAAHCATDHHEQVVTPDTVSVLPQIVWHAEEPTADSSMLPMYYLAQMARQQVTMVLSGDGADELLAGYETYQAYYFWKAYHRLPEVMRRGIIVSLVAALPVSHAKYSLDMKLKRFVVAADSDYETAHASWRIIFSETDKRALYRPEVGAALDGEQTTELYRAAFAKTNARHPLNRMLYADTRFYLPNDMLVKVDRMTMAHSLEARVPFLDHRLVEFAATVPPRLKLKGLRHKKYLLKASLRGRLPEGILWRRKQGFNLPKAGWLAGELQDFAFDHLSPQQIQRMGLFDASQVTRLLDEHIAKKRDNSHQIWGLLCLSLWWQQFIAQTAQSV
jgi:asparagine synthase (glutamine-hydrolysing)